MWHVHRTSASSGLTGPAGSGLEGGLEDDPAGSTPTGSGPAGRLDDSGGPDSPGAGDATHARPPRSRLAGWIAPEWMNRDLAIVMIARGLMSVARALAGVVVPIYLALQGFSALELGLLFLCVAFTSAILSSSIGLVSDRIGRRPFLVALPLFAAGAGLVFAFSDNTALLFVAASFGSFGRGAGASAGAVGPYQPAESALVTEAIVPQWRNSIFGRLAFMSSIGALGGGLLALLAGSGHPVGAAAVAMFRPAFIAASLFAALAGIVAIWIAEPRIPSREAGHRQKISLPRRSRSLLYRLWATNSINGFAIGMFGPFVAYWFYRRYGVGVGEIGVLFAAINFVTAFSSLSAAGLARRYGLVRTMTAVRAIQAILLVPMVLMPNFELAGAIYLIRMVVQRIAMPLRQSYVLAMAHPEERASLAALSNVPSQFAMAASPTLAGYLFDEVSLSLPFELTAVLQMLNAGMFWGFFHNLPPEEERVTSLAQDDP